MRKLHIYCTLVLLCSSCSKSILSVTSGSFIETLDFNDFDLYIFQLKGTDDSGKKRDCILETLQFESDVTSKKLLVYEELYVLLEKEGPRVLYVTTFSHKYIYNKGVFNSDLYDAYIPINEIDYIYTGYYDKERMYFYTPNGKGYKKNIEFFYTLNKDKKILEITEVTNTYPKKKSREDKPYLSIKDGDVLGIRMLFEKEQKRKFIYEKGGIITPVLKFHHNGDDIYFEIETESKYRYRKLENRVRFQYPLDNLEKTK